MSRTTSTSKRSPSILVTDVRQQQGKQSAPFARRLKKISVDNLLSSSSEVPSAQRRQYGAVEEAEASSVKPRVSLKMPQDLRSRRGQTATALLHGGRELQSRASKNIQRFVLIPEEAESPDIDATLASAKSDAKRTDVQIAEERFHENARMTSYCFSEGLRLSALAKFIRRQHKARVRIYDEAIFADYLLPLHPGDGNMCRIQSSLGDNRTMERMIDISEQGDHHYEYFSAKSDPRQRIGNLNFDPSEPQSFSPQARESNQRRRSGSAGTAAPMPLGENPAAETSSEDLGNPIDDAEPPEIPLDAEDDSVESDSHADDRDLPKTGEGNLGNARIKSFLQHAELFIFSYGVMVFWNFTEAQEKAILADVTLGRTQYLIRPYGDQDIETEEFTFTYTDEHVRPRVYNDMITLTSNNHMIKLALSHAVAQSTKLSRFEAQMQSNTRDANSIPRALALTGKLGMNRAQVLKISGQLYKLRVIVNLSSNVLDTPDFFWESERSLRPLYASLRQYLEIDHRISVINERCRVFLELTEMLTDTIAEVNMDRITVIVIWLIVLSICVSLLELIIRFTLLRKT